MKSINRNYLYLIRVRLLRTRLVNKPKILRKYLILISLNFVSFQSLCITGNQFHFYFMLSFKNKMVKIVMVVFSMALVLSIQFVVGQEAKEVESTPKGEEDICSLALGAIVEYMKKNGLVDMNKVESPQAKDHIKKSYELDKVIEKDIKSITGEEVVDEHLQHETLALTIEFFISRMGKDGLLDPEAVHKVIFPAKLACFNPEVEKVIAGALKGVPKFNKAVAGAVKEKLNKPQLDL